MRLKTLAAIVSFVLLTLNDGAGGQQSERSADTSPAWNDNSVITAQKLGGDPTRSGNVKIEFYGHDAFKVTSPEGLTVLTDPWRNDASGLYPKWFLHEFPAIRVDIVLSTHAHFDHDAVERPKGRMVLERLVGQFKLGDVEITGLADKHKCEPAPTDKPDSGSTNLHGETCPPNAIELIKTGGSQGLLLRKPLCGKIACRTQILPPNHRLSDSSAAIASGIDSVAHATKPSGLTSIAVSPLLSFAFFAAYLSRSFRVSPTG